MVEETPLERVQVVNSGARVQIPPSPFGSDAKRLTDLKTPLFGSYGTLTNKQQCNLENSKRSGPL